MDLPSRLNNINNRISKVFKNPHINFLIIMILVLFITCYSLLSSSLKQSITYILSNPVITVSCIILILTIGYFDIAIASLMLVFFFIILFGWTDVHSTNSLEGFKNVSDDDDTESTSANNEISSMKKHVNKITNSMDRTKRNLKIKEENDKKMDEKVKNIKDVVLGTINKYRQSNDNDYKQALLENKQTMYKEEQEHNTRTKSIINKSKQSSNKSNRNSNRKRENFQTVETRSLDPSNEEDTNLLITKEILQDMLNRIEFNYESNKYLRKYIKHRIEEIIDLNKLADDE